MTSEELGNCPTRQSDYALWQARRKVAQKMTDLILATADALEAENENRPWDALAIQPLPRREDADPELIRGFVNTPVYTWVVNDYINGNDSVHLLTKVVEILHELAPGIFRRPGY